MATPRNEYPRPLLVRKDWMCLNGTWEFDFDNDKCGLEKGYQNLDKLPLEAYKAHSELFEADLYGEISLETCVEKRISAGGTGLSSVEKQIEFLENIIK